MDPTTLISPPSQSNNPSNIPPEVDLDKSKFFDYQEAKGHIDSLIKDWEHELKETERRRKQRNIEVDVVQLQKSGSLKSDETLIPIRVIDAGIRKEMPQIISYVTQSRRLAVYECLDDPMQDVSNLEASFTKGMKYSGWEIPFVKVADGAATHGWDVIEVEFKKDRPLTVNLDHVGHENLIFPRDSKDIQGAERILRRYELTKLKLREFQAKFGFSKEQIDLAVAQMEMQKVEKNIEVYKVMFKYAGTVYIAWYIKDATSDWIKAPAPLYLGVDQKITTTVPTPTQIPSLIPGGQPIITIVPQIQVTWKPVYETLYPYKIFKYAETEQDSITEYKGRCYLDGPKQEAQTALWSIFINGAVRASNVYGSPKSTSGTGAPLKKMDLALEHSCFYSEPIEFWHTDFPDPGLVRAAEALESQTQAESGQLAAAVVNREDSRKTAKEIETATNLTNLLGSVQVILFSIFLRETFGHCWLIVQSQARQNLIKFCPIEVPQQVSPDGQQGVPTYQNDIPTIEKSYDLRAAGDVDVVERAEKLQKRGQLWAMVSQTALAMPFLIDILKESLPEDAVRYERILQQAAMQANQQQQMIGALGNVLKQVMTEDNGQIKPEFKQHEQQLQQLEQQAQQVMQQKAPQ